MIKEIESSDNFWLLQGRPLKVKIENQCNNFLKAGMLYFLILNLSLCTPYSEKCHAWLILWTSRSCEQREESENFQNENICLLFSFIILTSYLHVFIDIPK